MVSARSWPTVSGEGPRLARVEDIPALNRVFSDSFSERYRRDGMIGVRVPHLNPLIWRYAIEGAGSGAMLWADERGDVAAFNVVHRSGAEGWMGPLAVRPDRQALGLGKDVVRAGIERLRAGKVAVIGLETMPRTMDNIGFYSNLGFVPTRLTITLTLDGMAAERAPLLLGRLTSREQDDAVEECLRLTQSLIPGYDYTRELRLTQELALGDTLLLRTGERLAGYAICHYAPLVEGRAREELRVLKLVVDTDDDFIPLAHALADFARRSGTRRAAFRTQTEYIGAYQRLVAMGARVRWTDLRMTVADFPEPRASRGLVWSNWEI